jgi:methionyl-tRNA synthetase
MSRYYITTTLPYVNADPHIGFALEIVQADALARYHRLRGDEVIFNTGTDEHGQKIWKNATEAGMEPKDYCDLYAAKFHELKDSLNLSYTNFIRTTDDKHVKAAQEFWKRCDKAGDLYKTRYSSKYCVGCELEKTDSELVDGKCAIHPNIEIEFRDEENYFFRWSKYQSALLKHFDEHPEFVVPANRLLEIKKFIEAGLQDFSISRLASKMPWGIPVPGDSDHVMYVWFDALVNYISTLGWPDSETFKTYWPGVQVAGKDNLRQQSAMWQAMLLSAGVPLSKQIFIHGFITSGGQKMSKSLGNVVNPKELVKEFGVDAVRYFLLREIPSHDDGDFSLARMEERYAELANQLGNLVGRVAAMAVKYFGGDLGGVRGEGLGNREQGTGNRNKEGAGREEKISGAMENYDFKIYLDEVFDVVKEVNELVDKKAPFKLVKDDEAAAKAVLAQAAEMIRWIARALAPILPQTSDEILRRYGKIIEVGEPLFPRRDSE